MLIRYGFDVQLWQPTALITTMDVHESERNAIVWEDSFETSPSVSVEQTIDAEGNRLRRLVSGPGVLGMKMTGVVKNSGALDDCDPGAELIPVENLPAEALPYLRGSRYCETDLLSDFAWGNVWIDRGRPRTRAGGVRLRTQSTAFRLSGSVSDPHCSPSDGRASRSLPRFHPPCHNALPLPQHSGALLQRLSR
jgi:hypothetical protein